MRQDINFGSVERELRTITMIIMIIVMKCIYNWLERITNASEGRLYPVYDVTSCALYQLSAYSHMQSIFICSQFSFAVNSHMQSIFICSQFSFAVNSHMQSIFICSQFSFAVAVQRCSHRCLYQ